MLFRSDSDVYALGGRLVLYRSAGSSYIDWADTRNLVFRTVGTVGGGGTVTNLATLNATGLGIGVTSPGVKLDIGSGTLRIKNAVGDTSGLLIYQDTSDVSTFKNYYTGAFKWIQASTTAMTLDPSGNLGLGVTPSSWGSAYKAFDVSTTGAISNAGGTIDVVQNAYHNGTNWIYKTTAAASYLQQSSGSFIWNTATSGTAGNPITFTQAMTLDVNGNLGIGTSSPAAALSVSKQTTALSGTSQPYGVHIYPTGTGLCYIDALTSSTSNASQIGRAHV